MKSLIILQAATPNANAGYMQIFMLVAIVFVFYFFMIRPQMKRQKELRKFHESLQKGDKVIIAGGVYGKLLEVKDEYVVVEIDENVKVKVVKSTIIRDSSDIQPQK
ncbi:MAG: preprotein translocase subunit YajC [Bacteroidales bacterium]|nr:MAG: preprotein translocase subunit YajC [Bacteroidales bacterium]